MVVIITDSNLQPVEGLAIQPLRRPPSNHPQTSSDKGFETTIDPATHYGLLPPSRTISRPHATKLSNFESQTKTFLSMLSSTTSTQPPPNTPAPQPQPEDLFGFSLQPSKSMSSDLRNLGDPLTSSGLTDNSFTREFHISPIAPGMVDSFDSGFRGTLLAAVLTRDDNRLEELPADATEKQQIEWRRMQNTIAARKSGKRKLEYQQNLEKQINDLEAELQVWKEKALMLHHRSFDDIDGFDTVPLQESTLDTFHAVSTTSAKGLYNYPHQPTSALHTTASTLPKASHISAAFTGNTSDRQNLTFTDLPTQPRKYIVPSTTSRKEVPAAFTRKRARSQALDDEDEELPEPSPDATEMQQIEWKRRQNTLAARRSRKRKLEYQQDLERRVADLEAKTRIWKERASVLNRRSLDDPNNTFDNGSPFVFRQAPFKRESAPAPENDAFGGESDKTSQAHRAGLFANAQKFAINRSNFMDLGGSEDVTVNMYQGINHHHPNIPHGIRSMSTNPWAFVAGISIGMQLQSFLNPAERSVRKESNDTPGDSRVAEDPASHLLSTCTLVIMGLRRKFPARICSELRNQTNSKGQEGMRVRRDENGTVFMSVVYEQAITINLASESEGGEMSILD